MKLVAKLQATRRMPLGWLASKYKSALTAALGMGIPFRTTIAVFVVVLPMGLAATAALLASRSEQRRASRANGARRPTAATATTAATAAMARAGAPSGARV